MRTTPPTRVFTFALAALLAAAAAPAAVAPAAASAAATALQQDGAIRAASPRDGQSLYEVACARCHGEGGGGVDASRVAFTVPTPDFRDCSFSSREPDADWIAVAHQGGRVRAFDSTMPAFGEALSEEQLQAIIDYIRTFCGDDAWPRGELNLPRALVTEKAYPEDEAVVTFGADLEGPGAFTAEAVYERRFGARNQIELVLPVAYRRPDAPGDGAATGVGDIAFAIKRALWHTLETGSILSAGAELKVPTGDEERGLGKGVTVIEPFLSYGQLLPRDAFLQFQALAEFSSDAGRAPHEAAWRAVLGWSWTQGRFGRAWSPMLEVAGALVLEDGARAEWDLIPQAQVTLNKRQHVMANLGVRVPLTSRGLRRSRLLVYVLWDFFDGGFFDGW